MSLKVMRTSPKEVNQVWLDLQTHDISTVKKFWKAVTICVLKKVPNFSLKGKAKTSIKGIFEAHLKTDPKHKALFAELYADADAAAAEEEGEELDEEMEEPRSVADVEADLKAKDKLIVALEAANSDAIARAKTAKDALAKAKGERAALNKELQAATAAAAASASASASGAAAAAPSGSKRAREMEEETEMLNVGDKVPASVVSMLSDEQFKSESPYILLRALPNPPF